MDFRGQELCEIVSLSQVTEFLILRDNSQAQDFKELLAEKINSGGASLGTAAPANSSFDELIDFAVQYR